MADRKQVDEDYGKSPAKKLKIEDNNENESKKSASINVIKDWRNFEIKRVLNNNVTTKQIWLEGSFKDHDEIAIVLLEKKNFTSETPWLKKFFNDEAMLKNVMDNDAYGTYECFPSKELNGLKTTIIYPATQKHLDKFTGKEMHLVQETPELYNKITKPNVMGHQYSLQWVENILNHKAEADRIIYEDTDENKGFVMIPDLKWDGNLNTLYVLAIAKPKIKSIRDLNQSHLPLLRNILEAGTEAVVKKYDVPASKLRVYFHYLPSYFHLHVHFCRLSVEDGGIYAEKAHLLSTVISNIELMPDYYQKVTLTIRVFNDTLLEKYKECISSKSEDEPEEEC